MSMRIDADLAIIGDGEIQENVSIVLEDGKISYVGTQHAAPEVENRLTTPVVMPGMWDTHGHFSGFRTPSLEQAITTTPQVAAIRCTWDVHETLKSGFTSIREVGGLGLHLKKVIDEGIIKGPHIYASGSVISTTGGHADIHGIPLDIHDLLKMVNYPTIGELADGVGECYKAVRKQLRQGAQVIKYCASGGVMSEIDHPIHQQFSDEEQRAIVEEASRAEVAVAAHCHGAPGIRAAINAGVTSIEHGTYLTEELIEMMLERGTMLVPTRYVVEKLVEGAEKMGVPEYAMKKITALYDRHREAIEMAISRGVPIALGTDIFVSGPDGIFRWGDNAQELVYLTEMGMSTSDAIVAATGNGPKTLGKRAPRSGLLQEGYDADVLLLVKNPLDDIKVLTDRKNITHVIKSGNIEFTN